MEVVPQQTMASSTWDDPTEVNWGQEEAADDTTSSIVPPQKECLFKCTALYSYTVSILSVDGAITYIDYGFEICFIFIYWNLRLHTKVRYITYMIA